MTIQSWVWAYLFRLDRFFLTIQHGKWVWAVLLGRAVGDFTRIRVPVRTVDGAAPMVVYKARRFCFVFLRLVTRRGNMSIIGTQAGDAGG